MSGSLVYELGAHWVLKDQTSLRIADEILEVNNDLSYCVLLPFQWDFVFLLLLQTNGDFTFLSKTNVGIYAVGKTLTCSLSFFSEM